MDMYLLSWHIHKNMKIANYFKGTTSCFFINNAFLTSQFPTCDLKILKFEINGFMTIGKLLKYASFLERTI